MGLMHFYLKGEFFAQYCREFNLFARNYLNLLDISKIVKEAAVVEVYENQLILKYSTITH